MRYVLPCHLSYQYSADKCFCNCKLRSMYSKPIKKGYTSSNKGTAEKWRLIFPLSRVPGHFHGIFIPFLSLPSSRSTASVHVRVLLIHKPRKFLTFEWPHESFRDCGCRFRYQISVRTNLLVADFDVNIMEAHTETKWECYCMRLTHQKFFWYYSAK